MKTKRIPAVLRIITVEDSSIIVGRLTTMLNEINGVAYLGNANTIPAAIGLLNTTRPNVLILDINLGSYDGKNGIDLLIMIRKNYPKLKIIMLTNLSDERYRILCTEYGADYFFDKSNDFDKIPDTLNQLIAITQLPK